MSKYLTAINNILEKKNDTPPIILIIFNKKDNNLCTNIFFLFNFFLMKIIPEF